MVKIYYLQMNNDMIGKLWRFFFFSASAVTSTAISFCWSSYHSTVLEWNIIYAKVAFQRCSCFLQLPGKKQVLAQTSISGWKFWLHVTFFFPLVNNIEFHKCMYVTGEFFSFNLFVFFSRKNWGLGLFKVFFSWVNLNNFAAFLSILSIFTKLKEKIVFHLAPTSAPSIESPLWLSCQLTTTWSQQGSTLVVFYHVNLLLPPHAN